ncbi:PAS domain-containing sensor histidine kinase [Anaerosinus massiliensis]|uniref:PAS domain-containing sensor histidine kinase n=1 Tax=Massilibacillus massiliensis TaxID=1806837 RepID=UPI000A648358|nr:PAS domain-containing sensor histidine kinase [Massilibacillus massiliensis]
MNKRYLKKALDTELAAYHDDHITFVDNLPATVFVVDYKNRILTINEAGEQLFQQLNFTQEIDLKEFNLPDWLIHELYKFRQLQYLSIKFHKNISVDDSIVIFEITFSKQDANNTLENIKISIKKLSQNIILPDFQDLHKLYYDAFYYNSTAMVIFDENMRIVSLNKSCEKLFDISSEDYEGKQSYLGRISKKSYRYLIHYNHQHPAEERLPNYQTIEVKTAKGIRKTLYITTSFIPHSKQTLVSITDVIQEKTIFKKLLLDSSIVGNPFDQLPIITFISSLTGEIMEANQSFCIATGLSHDHIYHKNWLDLALDAKPDLHRDILRKLEANAIVENIEMTFNWVALEPPQRIGLLSARKICFKNKPAIIFTINDISQVHELANEIYRLERLNIASELAAGVGHEIRNPMTSVRGFLQMLSKKAEMKTYQSYFELMIEELDRANLIITEYLSLAKNKLSQVESTNINCIIRQILPLLQTNAITHNNFIDIDLNEIPDLLLDGKEIRQLLLNIVKNGLEAMQSGGKITIATKQDTQNIILSIKDEGPGIPDEIKEKIGTPFFTTKENGTGLGLSICYTIASKNNATITIDSSSKGTTFYIKFPLPNFDTMT